MKCVYCQHGLSHHGSEGCTYPVTVAPATWDRCACQKNSAFIDLGILDENGIETRRTKP